MQHGKLPRLLPMSGGGIFALGISFAAIFSKLIPYSSPNRSFHIVCLLILLFILDSFLFYSKFKFLFWSRLFLLGILLFVSLDVLFLKNSPLTLENRNTEHSVQFSETINRLLKNSGMSLELQAVTKGLVLGSSKFLPTEIKNRTREGGILHLFAASGLHLGIFMGFALILFKRVFRFYRPIPYILALIMGFLYLYVLAFPVSFLRAYCFAVYSITGIIFYRKTLPSDTLFYSAATIAIFQPKDFMSVGFLLSFGAVAGIFFLKPILDLYFFPKSKHMIKDNITLSLACSFSTFPTLVYFFHSFSFGSFWINLIVVPYSTLLLPFLYINLVLQYLVEGSCVSYIWKLSEFFLSIFMRIVFELTNSISYYFHWDTTPLPIILYMILIFLLFFKKYFERIFKPSSISIRQKSQSSSNSRTFIKIFFVICLFFGFHPFGIYYISSTNHLNSNFHSFFFKGNFLIQNESAFYFLGNCYAEKNFKKAEMNVSHSQIHTVYLEDESCLKYAIHLQKGIQRSYGKMVEIINPNSLSILPVFKREKDQLSILIRYNGDKKKLIPLTQTLRLIENEHSKTLKQSANFLILDFPSWSKEKPEDWKKFQKLLGISSYWKIMSVEELLARPLYNTDRDSELSIR